MQSTRVRIDQPGYECFNEELNGVKFTNGVSDEPIPVFLQNMLGAVFRLVAVDNDAQVGAAAYDIERRAAVEAAVVKPMSRAKSPPEPGSEVEAVDEKTNHAWTMDALEEIADKSGIAGLREIAEPMGIRGASIIGLMNAIMSVNEVK